MRTSNKKNPFGNPFKVGDRVVCPRVDQIPGTVMEVGYNGAVKVKYEDGQIGITEASELKKLPRAINLGTIVADNDDNPLNLPL